MSGALSNPTLLNVSDNEAAVKTMNHFQFDTEPYLQSADSYPGLQLGANRRSQSTGDQDQDASSLMEEVQKRLLQLKQELHEQQVALASKIETPQLSGQLDAGRPQSFEELSQGPDFKAAAKLGVSTSGQHTPYRPSAHVSAAPGVDGNKSGAQDLWPYWSCLTTPTDNYGAEPVLDKQSQPRLDMTSPASYCAPSGDRPALWSELTPRISSNSSAAPTGFTASSPLQATPVLSANLSLSGTGQAGQATPSSQVPQAVPVHFSLAATAQNVAAAAAQTAKVRFTPIIPPQVVGHKTASRGPSLQSNRDRSSLRITEKSGSSSGRELLGRGRFSTSREPIPSTSGTSLRTPLLQQAPVASPVDQRTGSPTLKRSRREQRFHSPVTARFRPASPTRVSTRTAVSPGRRLVAMARSSTSMPPVAVPASLCVTPSQSFTEAQSHFSTPGILLRASQSFTEAQSQFNTPGVLPRSSSSSHDLPEPGEVARQKESNKKDIMSKFKMDAEKLDQDREEQLANIRAMAEKGKQQYQQMMDQKVQNEELVLTQKFREQVMRLTQAAQARRAELERSAFAATLDYQQKKVEDMYLAQQSHMEKEYREAQEKIAAEIEKLAAQRTGTSLLASPGLLSLDPKSPLSLSPAALGAPGQKLVAVPTHERHTLGNLGNQVRASSSGRVPNPGFRLRPSVLSPSQSFVSTPTSDSRTLQLSESHQGVSFIAGPADVSPRSTLTS